MPLRLPFTVVCGCPVMSGNRASARSAPRARRPKRCPGMSGKHIYGLGDRPADHTCILPDREDRATWRARRPAIFPIGKMVQATGLEPAQP